MYHFKMAPRCGTTTARCSPASNKCSILLYAIAYIRSIPATLATLGTLGSLPKTRRVRA